MLETANNHGDQVDFDMFILVDAKTQDILPEH